MRHVSSEVVVVAVARDRCQVASDLAALTKPRVVAMVLVTTLVGYDVGLTGSADYLRMIHLLIGTLLAAGGTLALNQYRERDLDARMDRTRARPLPAGRLQPLEAWLFGVALTLLGTAYLAALVNPLVALVTLATTILYLFAYTPLKRRTPLCTLVGAVAGALPPVAGWAGPIYLAGALVLGLAFSAVGVEQALVPSPRAARHVLLASLIYLPLLLGLMAFDRI